MSTRILKLLTVVLPIAFMVAVIFLHGRLLPPGRELEGDIYAVLVVALGAIIFSIFIFNIIEFREEQIRQRSLQLEALHEAALALTTELDLQSVLQKVVDLSRELLNAKFGALAVLDSEGEHIAQFFTSGLDDNERANIGAPPKGLGLLSPLGPSNEPIIVDNVETDNRSAGFPEGHPPMHSMVGVPIKSKGEIFGNLYLSDKLQTVGNEDSPQINFEEADQQLLEKFATQAAIAIENAQLYRKTQELTVLQERERFSMDLHDGIMQSVYATGLSLQEAQHQLENPPAEVHKRMDTAIQDLSQVLRDIRNYILGLRPGRFQEQNIVKGVNEIAMELRANTLLNVKVDTLEMEEFDPWPGELTGELLFITQEALTNVRKHSHARNVGIDLSRDEKSLHLTISDDGVGFDVDQLSEAEGNGLRNMRERARNIGASIDIVPSPGRGTEIKINLPLPENELEKEADR